MALAHARAAALVFNSSANCFSRTSAPAGAGVTVAFALNGGAQPPVPSGAPLIMKLGDVGGTNLSRNGNIVTATFQLPPGPSRTMDVTVQFRLPSPPGGNVIYMLANGFTIN